MEKITTPPSYGETLTRPVDFITDTLGRIDVPIVYCDADVTTTDDGCFSRLERVSLVSNKPLQKYELTGEGIFIKHLSDEEVNRFGKSFLWTLGDRLGGYCCLAMGDHKYTMERWSVDALQEALGVGPEYIFARPTRLGSGSPNSAAPDTTDDAVIAHELCHAINARIGHQRLHDMAQPIVLFAYRKLDFGGLRFGYIENPQMLDEGIAYLAELVYLRKEHPQVWAKMKTNLESIARRAYEVNSHYIVPYLVLYAEMDSVLLEAMRESLLQSNMPESQS